MLRAVPFSSAGVAVRGATMEDCDRMKIQKIVSCVAVASHGVPGRHVFLV